MDDGAIDARGHNHSGIPAGWAPAEHAHMPRPTYWPAGLAFGITLLAWGLITTWIISLAGALIFGAALAGWIGELTHEHE